LLPFRKTCLQFENRLQGLHVATDEIQLALSLSATRSGLQPLDRLPQRERQIAVQVHAPLEQITLAGVRFR
jgi:hypothetical protein